MFQGAAIQGDDFVDANWLKQRLSNLGFQIVTENHVDLLQNTYGFIQSALNALSDKRQNALYRVLKNSDGNSVARLLELFVWSIPAVLVSPLVLIDLVLAGVFKRGATVEFIARIGKPND